MKITVDFEDVAARVAVVMVQAVVMASDVVHGCLKPQASSIGPRNSDIIATSATGMVMATTSGMVGIRKVKRNLKKVVNVTLFTFLPQH